MSANHADPGESTTSGFPSILFRQIAIVVATFILATYTPTISNLLVNLRVSVFVILPLKAVFHAI